MHDVAAAIRALGEDAGAALLAVAWLAPDGTPRALLEADAVVHAASTMKLPVLVELFRAVAAGEHSLGDTLVVRNAFRSLADGSSYRLDPADDSERGLYELEGTAVTLDALARPMITHSSNLAANLLVDLVGAARITATMASLGCPGLVVRRGLEDDRAFEAGLNNTVTALDLARLLARIARGEAVSPAASAAMEAILAGQAFNEGIPAGLPAGTPVAHKTGSITRLYHDAAIVRPPDAPPYVLAVLTTGLDGTTDGPALAARVSRVAWDRRDR